MSLAWAIAEYIHEEITAKTLFATHYHRLVEMEKRFKRVRNFNMAVEEKGDSIVFLRKVYPGGTDKSYGIHVAKLAGVPRQVSRRAEEILREMEAEEKNTGGSKKVWENYTQSVLFAPEVRELDEGYKTVVREIESLNLSEMAPIEALNVLHRLKKKIEDMLDDK